MKKSRLLGAVCGCVFFMFISSSAYADPAGVTNWIGGDGVWDNPANWSNGVPQSWYLADLALSDSSIRTITYQHPNYYIEGLDSWRVGSTGGGTTTLNISQDVLRAPRGEILENGTVNLSGGTLELGHDTHISGLTISGPGATLNLSDSGTIVTEGQTPITIGNGGTVNQSGGTVIAGTSINIKTGGQYNQTDGSVMLGLDLSLNGGVYQQDGGDVIANDSISVGSGQYNQTAGSVTISNYLATGRSGTYQQDGGNFNASTIELAIGNYNQTGGFATVGTVYLGDEGSYDLSGGDFSGSILITGAGNFNLRGGTLNSGFVEVGSNSEFNFDGGILSVGGFIGDLVNNGGTLAPGDSPGEMNIDGNYSQSIDGIFEVEIGGTGTGDFDVLNIIDTAIFEEGTAIDFKFINGFAPSTGDVFDFLIADIFASDMSLVDYTILGLQSGFLFDVDFTDANTFSLTALNDGAYVVPIPPALWLFGSGLLGLVGIARRRKTT